MTELPDNLKIVYKPYNQYGETGIMALIVRRDDERIVEAVGFDRNSDHETARKIAIERLQKRQVKI